MHLAASNPGSPCYRYQRLSEHCCACMDCRRDGRVSERPLESLKLFDKSNIPATGFGTDTGPINVSLLHLDR